MSKHKIIVIYLMAIQWYTIDLKNETTIIRKFFISTLVISVFLFKFLGGEVMHLLICWMRRGIIMEKHKSHSIMFTCWNTCRRNFVFHQLAITVLTSSSIMPFTSPVENNIYYFSSLLIVFSTLLAWSDF